MELEVEESDSSDISSVFESPGMSTAKLKLAGAPQERASPRKQGF